jgi:hypothetical protein
LPLQTDRQTEEQIHLLRVGWRNLFSSCAVCCVSFWFWREIGFGLHTYVLRVQASDLMVTDRLFFLTAGYLRFGGKGTTLFFWRIVLGSIFFRLRILFGARFRYKLMYYNLYHASELREFVRFLRKIECIKFECNTFLLVLVQIDLIHFENLN